MNIEGEAVYYIKEEKMITISQCWNCRHRISVDKRRHITTCDAFPEGKPRDFNPHKEIKGSICNNGIGFESEDKYKGTDMEFL